MDGSVQPTPAIASASMTFGRPTSGDAMMPKNSSAHPARIPKNTGIASCRLKPACTRRSWSLLISDGDFGTIAPRRFRLSTTRSYDTPSTSGFMPLPDTSPRRRRIIASLPGASARPPAATSRVTVAKARSGMRNAMLDLDLDYASNPDESDELHHDGRQNRHLPDSLL